LNNNNSVCPSDPNLY